MEDYFGFFEGIYSKKFEKLIELDLEIIEYFLGQFDIKTKIIFASELKISEDDSNKNLSICKELGADVYLSGEDGKNYLNIKEFDDKGISVEFQNFKHPTYNQCYQTFISHMSALDLLFNEGKESIQILKNAINF